MMMKVIKMLTKTTTKIDKDTVLKGKQKGISIIVGKNNDYDSSTVWFLQNNKNNSKIQKKTIHVHTQQ